MHINSNEMWLERYFQAFFLFCYVYPHRRNWFVYLTFIECIRVWGIYSLKGKHTRFAVYTTDSPISERKINWFLNDVVAFFVPIHRVWSTFNMFIIFFFSSGYPEPEPTPNIPNRKRFNERYRALRKRINCICTFFSGV